MDRLPDCRVRRRVFADLDRPRATGPYSVRTRASARGWRYSGKIGTRPRLRAKTVGPDGIGRTDARGRWLHPTRLCPDPRHGRGLGRPPDGRGDGVGWVLIFV